jgi:hypothetical protein
LLEGQAPHFAVDADEDPRRKIQSFTSAAYDNALSKLQRWKQVM